MISRIGLLFLALWLGASPAAAADHPAPGSPASDQTPPSLDRLRRVSEPEFMRSLVGGVLRGKHPEVRLSHGHAETFLPGGRYRVTSGPLEGSGSYSLRSGVLCVWTDAEPQRPICRVILTDGGDRFFARPARSPDDRTGYGPIAELQMDPPGPSSAH